MILAPYKLSCSVIPPSLHQLNFHVKTKSLIPKHNWNNFYVTYSNHTLKYSLGTPTTVLDLCRFITSPIIGGQRRVWSCTGYWLFLPVILPHSGSAKRQNQVSMKLHRMFIICWFYIQRHGISPVWGIYGKNLQIFYGRYVFILYEYGLFLDLFSCNLE